MAEFISAEFDPINLRKFVSTAGDRHGINRTERGLHVGEALEPAFHALLKQAIAKCGPDAKVRIALALSPVS